MDTPGHSSFKAHRMSQQNTGSPHFKPAPTDACNQNGCRGLFINAMGLE